MKCDFCGEEIPKGEGIVFVRKSGKKLVFCSNKCEKNKLKLKRKPRNLKWANPET